MFTKQPPIYLVGLPRTGTTWIASVLSNAPGVKFLHEPFNADRHPEMAPYRSRFLRANDLAPEFLSHCQAAFAGMPKTTLAPGRMNGIYQRFPWFPGRILIKDVHTLLALEWLQSCFPGIKIVITIRHPCAVAASWFRLGWKTDKSFPRLLHQPELTQAYLNPFQAVLKKAETFWQKMGAFWGASYFVVLNQLQHHPDWILLQHEALCSAPIVNYQRLFQQLGLRWSPQIQKFLTASTQTQSNQSYGTQRITSQEANKWRSILSADQIQQVREFVEPFGLSQYAQFDSESL